MGLGALTPVAYGPPRPKWIGSETTRDELVATAHPITARQIE